MNDIDVLARAWRIRKIGEAEVVKGVERIARKTGMPPRVIANLVDKSCSEQAGRAYTGPTDFLRTWQTKGE